MTNTTTRSRVEEVAAALLRDTGTIDLHGDEAALFIHVVRRLAEGSPISPQEVERIAAEVNLSGEQAAGVLDWLAEKNEAGEIIGLGGLSLNQWNHTFRIGERDLSTWCALDTLYLPQVIKQPAEVESRDPVSQAPIRFLVGSSGSEGAPPGAVVSIVVPEIAEKGIESAEEIWNAFCSYSLFFAAEETASQWFAGKHVEPVFLSIEEGYELARRWFAQIISVAEGIEEPDD